MTSVEIAQALALGRCTFTPGSTAKRFVAWAAGIAASTPERRMSSRGSSMLNRLAHQYRRKLGRCLAVECTKCPPAEQPSLPTLEAPPFSQPAPQSTTAERFADATINRGWCALFIALEESEDGEHHPVGGRSPTTYKTLRNARRAAGNDGFVLIFDPTRLPLVGDEATHTSVDFGQRLDEDAFAERQMLYWADEVARIRAR